MSNKLFKTTITKKRIEIWNGILPPKRRTELTNYTRCQNCRQHFYYAYIEETQSLNIMNISLGLFNNFKYYHACNSCYEKVEYEDMQLMDCGRCTELRNCEYFCKGCTKLQLYK